MNMCKRCGLPEGLIMWETGFSLPTTLKVELDDHGICNLCNEYDRNPYNPEAAHPTFVDLINQTKGTQPYDAIVGVSGGKDGCYVAYDLVRKYDLKILISSNQAYQPQEATIKCDEFAEKLQKKYPDNVTYLPYRKEDASPSTRLMFKKSFLTNGLPCAWCGIEALLAPVCYPHINQCAPLFINGVEPKQMYKTINTTTDNPWGTIINRYQFEKSEDFQQVMLDKLSKEIAVLFNNDQEEMERVLSLKKVFEVNNPESPYYLKKSLETIKKCVTDQSKKEYLLKAVQDVTFENNKHFTVFYFAFHNYDENMIRETLKNDLNYTAPSTHADCCMHGVVDYISVQKDLLPLNHPLFERAALARMGEISKEEVESMIVTMNDRITYPSEKDLQNFCEFLDITEKEFNATIGNLKESFRKYLPKL